MMRLAPILVPALLLLAACSDPMPSLPPLDSGPAETPLRPAGDACGAEGLQVLVGKDLVLFQAQARSGPVRILRPGQAVTKDYSAERLNVSVDAADQITAIACG